MFRLFPLAERLKRGNPSILNFHGHSECHKGIHSTQPEILGGFELVLFCKHLPEMNLKKVKSGQQRAIGNLVRLAEQFQGLEDLFEEVLEAEEANLVVS